MSSYKEQFADMIKDLRNEVNEKNDLIQMRLDRQEKSLSEYVEFCDTMEKHQKLQLRKKKIASLLND